MRKFSLLSVCAIASLSTILWSSNALFPHIAKGPSAAIASQQTWQPLSDMVSPAMLRQIFAETIRPDAPDIAALSRSATGYQQGDLLVFTFNARSMCGRGGCWVFGYRASAKEKVFSTVVTGLGADRPIVELVDNDLPLPCVRLSRYTQMTLQNPEEAVFCERSGNWNAEAL